MRDLFIISVIILILTLGTCRPSLVLDRTQDKKTEVYFKFKTIIDIN